MCRTLLLPLVVGGLALGLPFVRGHLAERDGRAAAFVEGTEEHGVLAVSGSTVHFTLYRPEVEAGGERSILIFAADARASHPRPVRLFAKPPQPPAWPALTSSQATSRLRPPLD